MPGESNNTITGYVLESDSGEPISFAYIHLEELDRTTTTDINGYFELTNIPSGELIINIHRLGYKTKRISIEIEGLATTKEIEILLTPTLLSSQAIEVTSSQITSGSNLAGSSQKIFGDDLRQQLGSTLSQTLANLPGISQRTMGTAPGRPVIRGLGDERVSIREDGINTGDVSDQSDDHVVTIDVSTAQEVEIARGPTALVYGANAVGGVINVVSNRISTTIPTRITGNATLTGESVNTGGANALSLAIPYQSMAIKINANGRTALDTETPLGPVRNTYINSYSTSIGMSYVQDWGYIGGSFSYYDSEYGIPPDPNGHPSGVDLDLQKYQYVLKSEYIFNHPFLKVLEMDFSVNNYFHEEIESSGVVGTEFGLVTTNFQSIFSHGKAGFFDNGNFGIALEMEDYAVFGFDSPNSNSYSAGAFIIEEKNFGKLHVSGGLRFDYVLNAPKEDDPNSSIGDISSRTFSALSSSVSATYGINNKMNIGATILRSFRAPSLDELYTEGPHLASYSYDVGNPDLEAERGWAKELFISYNSNNTLLLGSIYHNGFSNYIYLRNTGEPSTRFPDLNVYENVGTNAQLYGFELSAEQQLLDRFLFRASLNYTVGRRDSSPTNSDQVPLPRIPPFEFKSSLKYSVNNFEIGSRYIASAEQNDLGDFETRTDGFFLLDAFASYNFTHQKILHTFSINVYNILDETYYNHLSRIKDLNPEAGRNIIFLYRLYF